LEKWVKKDFLLKRRTHDGQMLQIRSGEEGGEDTQPARESQGAEEARLYDFVL
jgi:hypothetical protein